MINPLLGEWDAPFGTPPFDKILLSHYKPAIEEAINSASEEIKAITDNTDRPDFGNTVAALDKAGESLGRITSLLFNLNSAETSGDLQTITQDVSPRLTRFSNDITLNKKLFARIRKLYYARETSELNAEQKMLVEKKYRSFILGGAALKEKEVNRFRKISEELSILSLKFEQNILEETNSFELHITDRSDLKGLPDDLIETASTEADSRKKEGWVFTLHFPSYVPFMQYSEKRELREIIFKAYTSRAFRENEYDNRSNILKIVNLRLELARLLG
jgi:peptidyl-dipeptidase Dcp